MPKEMDLTGKGAPEEGQAKPVASEESTVVQQRGTPSVQLQEPDAPIGTVACLGNLEIEGVDIFTLHYSRNRTRTVWTLLDRRVFDKELSKEELQGCVVAVLQTNQNGSLQGFGKTYYLTRFLDTLSAMMYKCVNQTEVNAGLLFTTGEYSDSQGNFIKFNAWRNGCYQQLALASEGFRLDLTRYGGKLPVKLPRLEAVQLSLIHI